MNENIFSKVPVKWFNKYEANDHKTQILNKDAVFYEKCFFGELTINLGDHVLITNTDAPEAGSFRGCDVARVIHLYEIFKTNNTDSCRALVQWFSWPKFIPKHVLDSNNLNFDFENEVIEDHRTFESDITLESIYRRCDVIYISAEYEPLQIMPIISASCSPMFFCRYKYTRVKSLYHLVPIKSNEFNIPTVTNSAVLELFNTVTGERKVSPIKIVGGCSVMPTSSERKVISCTSTQKAINECSKLNAFDLNDTAKSRLNNSTDSDGDKNELNYSIVQQEAAKENDINIKLKLRVSHSHKTVKCDSLNLKIEDTSGCMFTPNKLRKLEFEKNTQKKLPGRRKSILKNTAASSNDRTLKRSIKLSNKVERCEYNENDVLLTRNTTLNQHKVTHHTHDYNNLRSSNQIREANESTSEMLQNINFPDSCPVLAQSSALIADTVVKSRIEQASEKLHVSVVPLSLPCREKEFDSIYNFIRCKIEDECGGCMYVSGVPGTGKTATVTSVIQALHSDVKKSKLNQFDFLEINGMRLTEPRQAYVQINRQLTGKTVPWEQALMLLEKRFKNTAPHRITTVLLVDELDILCNRRQDVVYNLLDWPSTDRARLVVITIANTMDLPERLLKGNNLLSFIQTIHENLKKKVISLKFINYLCISIKKNFKKASLVRYLGLTNLNTYHQQKIIKKSLYDKISKIAI